MSISPGSALSMGRSVYTYTKLLFYTSTKVVRKTLNFRTGLKTLSRIFTAEAGVRFLFGFYSVAKSSWGQHGRAPTVPFSAELVR